MPVVPFAGVPSVAPSGQPESYLRTPSGLDEAAGVGVARAMQGLGGQIEKTGDMLAQHAVAFQNLQNESAAKDADVDAMVKIGTAQSEFDRLEGDNATKALPGHMQRIKDIRQEALDGMKNPAARRMLDQSISRRVGFALVDAGARAGNQAKVAVQQARTARVEVAKVGTDLQNPETLRGKLSTIDAETEQLGEEMGAKRETIDNIKRKERSALLKNSFLMTAPNNPQLANDRFEEMKDQLEPQDREVVQTIVNRNMTSHQTRIDGDQIMKSIGFDPSKGPGQEDKMWKAAEKYKEKNKTNPDYADGLDQRLKNYYATGMNGYRDKQNGFEHTIGNFIIGQDDANRVVSIDGVIGKDAPPEIRAAYDGLEYTKQKKVLGWITKMADGSGRTLTPERVLKENELKGMASDPERAEEFVALGPDGIMAANLTLQQTRGLLKTQREMGTQPKFIDSFVNKAMRMSSVDSLLQSADITRGKTPKEYSQFRGAFESVIRDAMGDKGILPPPKELEAMASRLLQDQHADKWYRLKSEIYKGTDVPTDARQEIIQLYKDRKIENPSDEQIARAWSLVLYKRLYGEGKAPKADKQ